jgi:hypothetical protein
MAAPTGVIGSAVLDGLPAEGRIKSRRESKAHADLPTAPPLLSPYFLQQRARNPTV